MAGVEGAVGVLDDDAVDGKIEVCGLADGKIVAEGGAGDLLDLGEGEAAGDALGVALGFADKAVVELGGGVDFQVGFFEMKAVAVA